MECLCACVDRMTLAKIWDRPHVLGYKLSQYEMNIFEFFDAPNNKLFFASNDNIQMLQSYVKYVSLTRFSSYKWQTYFDKYYPNKPKVCYN